MERKTYFWADTHFNHRGILGYTSRPWKTVEEMNRGLMAIWNATVRNESDDVWVLGDFGFTPRREWATTEMDLMTIFWGLRGRKNLVVGNHDEKNQQVLRLPWERIERLVELKIGGKRATLCHYPLETWPASWSGSMMLHGHCHGTLKRKVPKRFDVGVDTPLGKEGPILWEELVDLASLETFFPVDGHGDATMKEGGNEDE
jgi:calcineurin-like phosphoesterase family protein